MGEHGFTPGSEPGDDEESPKTPAEKNRPWTREEMDAAEPVPMPEVPDDGPGEPADWRVAGVRFTPATVEFVLTDDSTVAVPLRDVPLLLDAGQDERDGWLLVDAGRGVHWRLLGLTLGVSEIMSHRPS